MFWERLNQLCAEHNVKLTNVVKELGMSTGNQSKWKNGVVPKSNVLKKFADYFNVSVDYLLGNATSKIVNPNPEKDETEIPDMESTLLYFFANCGTIERISEPFIVWGTVFVQTIRHSLP